MTHIWKRAQIEKYTCKIAAGSGKDRDDILNLGFKTGIIEIRASVEDKSAVLVVFWMVLISLQFLSTGFGNSIIYHIFSCITSKIASNNRVTVMVYSPLKNITENQLSKANGLRILAASLTISNAEQLKSLDIQLLFYSA